jgi:YihY family inner membrane protein
MPAFTANAAAALRHPLAFALAVLKQFRANQGLLLAGAVAYYALLSLVPLLILVVLALTRVFEEAQVLAIVHASLAFVVPGQSDTLVGELRTFLAHREAVGSLLLLMMLFFSSLAFTVLENAMSVIFFHRVKVRRRHFLVSAVMPYLFILSLAIGLLLVTLVAGALQHLGTRTVVILGRPQVLDVFSSELLYLLGVLGEILLLTAVYLVMPVGRLSLRQALIGGTAAALLWEVTRHVLVWYYATISQIQLVYGSLTTAIAALVSVELGAIVLLLGAQVIAEYERIGHAPIEQAPAPIETAGPPPPA